MGVYKPSYHWGAHVHRDSREKRFLIMVGWDDKKTHKYHKMCWPWHAYFQWHFENMSIISIIRPFCHFKSVSRESVDKYDKCPQGIHQKSSDSKWSILKKLIDRVKGCDFSWGCPIDGSYPQLMVYNGKSHSIEWFKSTPPFQETSSYVSLPKFFI